MKRLLILPFFISLAYAEPTPVGPINFSGGLNLASLATLIPDQDSSDLCNCSPSIVGAMAKRNGSKRFIEQAISSNPVTSIQRVYSSTESNKVVKSFIGASYEKIFVSTDDSRPQWVVISSANSHNQHYNLVQMNGKVLIAGESLKENVRTYDIAKASFGVVNAFNLDTTTTTINPRGKHQIVANNYYILANVQISTEFQHLKPLTTYYASRLVWSKLNNFSSMSAVRFLDYNQDDGEEITGLGNLYGGSSLVSGDFKTIINVFKPSKIGELSFTVLDLPSLGGDWVFSEVATGVGCIAPRTLVTTPGFYAFLDKSGILMWDRTQFKNISAKIKPLIDELIRSGRYRNSVMTYYPKKEWLLFSYENSKRFPKGKNNHILVYDIRTGEWWPFCNWQADSFTVADNAGDNGQLYYGDSIDGYVHLADVETKVDDSPMQIPIDVMDSSYTWSGSSQNAVEMVEGTASLKLSIYGIPASGFDSSTMTRIGVFGFGEWSDKDRVTLDDKISFKAFAHNVTSISYLRIDLEVNNTEGAGFDTNFTSVSISSIMFSGDRVWDKFEIPLSSFQSRNDWTDLSIESVSYYNRFNYYGIRFCLGGVWLSSVSIDDLRLVEDGDNANNMYRTTKLFDMQSPSHKSFGTALLTMEKPQDSSFNVDIYNDFGQKLRIEKLNAEVPKEILTFRDEGRPGFTIRDSIDYSVKSQTRTVSSHWDCYNGVMDSEKIVCGDRVNDRLLMFDRNDLSTFTHIYGSFGSGTSNFNIIHEIRQYGGGYLLSDLVNQRVKVHSLKNLGFLKMSGSLGEQATSYHQPTGVGADNSNFFVSDESSDRITKLEQSTFGVVQSINIDHNVIADSSLDVGDKDFYIYYNHVSDEGQDVELLLESRDKGSMEITNSVSVKPLGVSTGSYYTNGSIGILGRYLFIPFHDDTGQDFPAYYIQKRLRSNFEVVSQYATDSRFLTSSGYSLSFNPILKTEKIDLKVSGRYLQMKFYDDNILDNYWSLYNIAPLLNVQGLTY